ncbi:response regulator [Variovorax sp. HJSM1_2]|uniref:response regulator n=1 Tax=Variovorax sp. HJSM1_2 TaxID=3366263 RepID=UPI003BD8A8F6
MAAGRTYDVLLIDWRIEPMDGIETLTRLRKHVGEGIRPSILVTAFDQEALVRRARDAKFDAVILKSIEASALLDRLMVLLHKEPSYPDFAPVSQASKAEVLLQERHAGQRILLAEDNPVNRERAFDLLQMAGLMVEAAEDGGQAIEMVQAQAYDLILMDVQMPVMDGMVATRVIRRSVGEKLPIIAMTANAFLDDRQACLDAGMNDHMEPQSALRHVAALVAGEG